MPEEKLFHVEIALLMRHLFHLAGSAPQDPAPQLRMAVLGNTAQSGLIAAAMSIRAALCQSPQGRQALRDLGLEPVLQQVEGE